MAAKNKKSSSELDLEQIDENEEISEEQEEPDLKSVLSSSITTTDWTVDTLVNQLRKGNIELSPQFQRRFAWRDPRKSKFIESLALNYPVPHIVLARDKKNPTKLIVLDGKQRLMTIAQFFGVKKLGEKQLDLEPLALSNLTIKKAWNKESFDSLRKKTEYKADLDLLENATIRSVIVSTWNSEEYLYSVFVRLNLGSLPLSPQELRQALRPGEFTNFADTYSADSVGLKTVLGLSKPDFRMRDVELLIRFLGFRKRSSLYSGNLKAFLDDTCDFYNKNWSARKAAVEKSCEEFEAGIALAIEIFGKKKVLRKHTSDGYETRINRAVFDVISYALANSDVRDALSDPTDQEKLRVGFERLCTSPTFVKSIESTTKSISATHTRFDEFLKLVRQITKVAITTKLPAA